MAFRKARVAENPGKVQCLGYCGKAFLSPNRILIRICPKCKHQQALGGELPPDLSKRGLAVSRKARNADPNTLPELKPSKFNFKRKTPKGES